LEEAIDYVGLLIKNLKDKRTKLVKNIEDELVDIGNLKEKLGKINQFISEEKQGLEDLSAKRSRAEKDADEVGSIVYNMRDRIAEIDKIVADEANRIKSFKESRSSSS
jgi:chromosome segregation ATPase